MVRVSRMSILVLVDGAHDAARYLLACGFYATVIGTAGFLAVRGTQGLAAAGLPALSASVLEASASSPAASGNSATVVKGVALAGGNKSASAGRVADMKTARGKRCKPDCQSPQVN
jgi:hypothetical protein